MNSNSTEKPLSVWLPAIQAGSGADTFTTRLAKGLQKRGIRAEIEWLPHSAEYLPWRTPRIAPPDWATIAQVNTWLPERFIPTSIPFVATMLHNVHDPAFSPYKTLAQKIYHRLWVKPIERNILDKADAIVAISHYTAASLIATFGSRKVTVIHIGIEQSGAFQPLNCTSREPDAPFRLIYIGNHSKRKGTDLLAPIMDKLGKEFELLYSSGKGQAGDRPMPENCRSLGFLADDSAVARELSKADALLFPSRLEGFGQAAIEAMACGTPVIATRSSSLPEVIDDGVTGYLCEQDNVDDFVAAIRKLASSPELLSKQSTAARAHVIRHFDEEDMIDRHITLYQSVLARCESKKAQ